LITETGEQKGIVKLEEAIELANNANLDLVEISPNGNPPVCKILDFGKYRFERQKKKKLNKKKQHIVHLKEIRIRPNTGDHDLITKLNKGQKFLLKGDKLKITVMFRGREMTRKEAGYELLKRVTGILEEIAEIDKDSSLEGRRMSIILRPR
jgi:translation initiation factor IF-3